MIRLTAFNQEDAVLFSNDMTTMNWANGRKVARMMVKAHPKWMVELSEDDSWERWAVRPQSGAVVCVAASGDEHLPGNVAQVTRRTR